MTPRGRLVWLFVLAGAAVAASPWVPAALVVGLAANVVVVALALVDLLITPSPGRVVVTRELAPVLSVGARNPVRLRVESRARLPLRVELSDSPPQPSRVEGLPARVRVPGHRARELSYTLTPGRRGRHRFGPVYLRFPSRLGLWLRSEERPLDQEVKVFPDIQAVHRYELLARRNRLAEEGYKLWRLRGQGGEFERLREYRREDEVRRIDWKATAKMQTLISREFTVERNQNVLFLLDCGRSMVNEADGVPHMERGLNTAVMLSYIALSQGDNVSFLAFSNRIERFVGPVRGKLAVQRIIRAAFDLEASYDAADYSLAIEEVLRRQRKRALVILVTHALDEQHLAALSTYLQPLTRSHLLLVALLRDVGLTQLAEQSPSTELEAFHVAAAAEILAAQARMVAALADRGVMVLQTTPGALSAVVINQYLDVKARHLL